MSVEENAATRTVEAAKRIVADAQPGPPDRAEALRARMARASRLLADRFAADVAPKDGPAAGAHPPPQ